MSVGTSAALAIGLGATAAGGIASSVIGSNAAKSAANTQTQAAQSALDYTKQAEAPYLAFGNTAASQLGELLKNGTFGPGSLPSFTLPTEGEVQATPGFQFTKDQGDLSIARAAAAAGGAFTGGTLKQAAAFGTGLSSTYYQNAVQNALNAYGANLSKNAQEYQQLITPVTIGANAASGTSTNVANLLTQIGNAQSAGQIGGANAIINGINGATGGIGQSLLLSSLLRNGGGLTSGSLNPLSGIFSGGSGEGTATLNNPFAGVPG